MAYELSAVIRLTDQFSGNMRKVRKSVEEFNKSIDKVKKVGDTIGSVGRDLTKKVTLPLTGIATAAVMTGAKFDDVMAEVRSISGATGEHLQMLRDQAIDLGETTAHSTSTVAEAQKQFALSGWGINEILAGTSEALNLASAGGLDMATTTDIMSDAMAQFSMSADEAKRMTDVLAKAQASANTSVLHLGEALKYGGADAAAAGMEIEQMAAVLGMLADQSIKGSSAGTVVSAMLRDMRSSAVDGILNFEAFKVALYDANGEMRALGDVMADVEKATAGMTTQQRDAALSNVYQTQSLRGVNSMLSEGSERYYELLDAARNSTGYAAEAAAMMEDTMGGSFRSLASATEGFMIALSDELTPTIRPLIDMATEWVRKFGELDDRTRKIIVTVGALAAAVGPLAIGIGMVVKVTGTMVSVIRGATVAATLFGKALFANPIGLVIAGIAILTAGIVWLVRNWDKVTEKTREVWAAFKGFGADMVNIGADMFTGLWDGMKGVWGDISGWIGDKMSWLTDKLTFWRRGNKEMASAGGGGITVDGSHFGGLWRVPFDGYIAKLHKGERVLTARQADAFDTLTYDQIMGIPPGDTYNTYNTSTSNVSHGDGKGSIGGVNITIESMIVRQESDIDAIADVLFSKTKAAWEAGA